MDQVYFDLIKDKDYCDIAKYVEELYLSDCDLLILMARKFFTLFMLFQEFNKQKYELLGIPYTSGKTIITNLALPLYQDRIQSGKIQKIIIADDIIIHGRGVRGIYDTIKKWNNNCEIQISSYLRNDEEKTFYADIMNHFQERYHADVDYWRMVSTRIVNSFYITGRPYISYLPYFEIRDNWQDLVKVLNADDCYEISNEAMQQNSVKGILYTGKELNDFKVQEYCAICALRFYFYEKINKVIVIPYFCLDVINSKAFYQLSNSLRNNNLRDEYLTIVSNNNGAEEMRLREIEYCLSYWLGLLVSMRLNLNVNYWNNDSEIFSFGMHLLKNVKLSENGILAQLENLKNDISEEIIKPEDLIHPDEDIVALEQKYTDLIKKYEDNLREWTNMDPWETYSTKPSYTERFLEDFMAVNGGLDEERLNTNPDRRKQSSSIEEKNKHGFHASHPDNKTESQGAAAAKESKRRLLGLPLTYILRDLGQVVAEARSVNLEKTVNMVFASVISIVDSGKGSIFTRIVNDRNTPGTKYFESLLHAGEQNYVFYENTNFPVMYAFYVIEQHSPNKKLKKMKSTFLKKFKQFIKNNNIYFNDSEMKQLMKMNITSEYGRYLQQAYYRHKDNPVLEQAIKIAYEIERD